MESSESRKPLQETGPAQEEVIERALHARPEGHQLTDEDGKIDNSMGDFFSMVTPEKEDEFLRIMNEYPI